MTHVPEGWRLVPVEPTEMMFSATREQYWEAFQADYRAILDAAPATPVQQAEPVATANIIRAPFRRAQIGAMAGEIQAVIDSYAGRASVAEAMGVLEIVKQDIYRTSMEAL